MKEFEELAAIWGVAKTLTASAIARSQLVRDNARIIRESAPIKSGAGATHKSASWPIGRTSLHTAAAALIVATMVVIALNWQGEVFDPQRLGPSSSAVTTVDQISRYTLSDGSVLILNADSLIRIDFSRTQRVVILEKGEAFFDVTRDPNRKFFVRAGEKSVVVTGTSFNVNVASPDKAIEVAVVAGHVRVTGKYDNSSKTPDAVLNPGDAFVFPAAGLSPVRKNLSADQIAAWRSRKLYFDHQPLSEVLFEINRYTPKPLVLSNKTPTSITLSGSFNAGDVDSVIFSLRELYNMEVSDQGTAWQLSLPKASSTTK